MAGKKVSRKGKGQYASYKALNSFAKNKKRVLERHVKQFPEDAQAKKALAEVGKSTPRTKPEHIKARLDSWACRNEKDEYVGNRSRNSLSGRLSAWGKFTQEAARFSKGVANAKANDSNGKLFGPAINPQEVWSGWADFINPKPKETPKVNNNKKQKHKNNKRK